MRNAKYDYLCDYVEAESKADAVVVVALHGLHGTGCCVRVPAHLREVLSDLLASMAAELKDPVLFPVPPSC